MAERNEGKSLKIKENPEIQEARAFLRERYLRFVTGIVGKMVNLNLYEKTRVNGEFRGCDVDCFDIFVRNLQTPLGNIPETILRSSDVICLEIEDIKDTE